MELSPKGALQLKPRELGLTTDWEGVAAFKNSGGQFEDRGYSVEVMYSGSNEGYAIN